MEQPAAQLRKLRCEERAELAKVLTPEQRAKLRTGCKGGCRAKE
jgi:Spy/CpxP family protein refolding chaperone